VDYSAVPVHVAEEVFIDHVDIISALESAAYLVPRGESGEL
jgi:hypothetical protein